MNSESPRVDMILGMAEEAFQADCQEYVLKGTYKLVIVLRWAKFSQAEFLVLLVNWLAVICTPFNALVCPVNGSQLWDPEIDNKEANIFHETWY